MWPPLLFVHAGKKQQHFDNTPLSASMSLTWLSSCPVCPQLQAARDPGARPVSSLPAIRREADRLPAVQQPEEPGQVQRAGAGLLPEELRRRWPHTLLSLASLKICFSDALSLAAPRLSVFSLCAWSTKLFLMQNLSSVRSCTVTQPPFICNSEYST